MEKAKPNYVPEMCSGKARFQRALAFKWVDPRRYTQDSIRLASFHRGVWKDMFWNINGILCPPFGGAGKGGTPLQPFRSRGRSLWTRSPKAMGYDLRLRTMFLKKCFVQWHWFKVNHELRILLCRLQPFCSAVGVLSICLSFSNCCFHFLLLPSHFFEAASV